MQVGDGSALPLLRFTDGQGPMGIDRMAGATNTTASCNWDAVVKQKKQRPQRVSQRVTTPSDSRLSS